MRQIDIDELEFPGDSSGAALLDGKPFTGEAVRHADGRRVELRTFIEGYEDGPVLRWSPSGKLIVQGSRKHPHGAVGPWHEWDEEGRLLRETVYDALGNQVMTRELDRSGNIVKEERTAPTRLRQDPETGERAPAPWL
ncbi:toxin-antitoxin system YwqK family antitoxin [Nocardiopsis sp. FIRDI 009]|uniref:toxin-antitoxin system YwqK family antitoxin n=1 Tax=Nocardiopsis sp. FIRDI 009 TaxID=714197 RepID=UPI000E234095|nr:hypothetical protein [Nocardiopsis sp. FIRDI 009]